MFRAWPISDLRLITFYCHTYFTSYHHVPEIFTNIPNRLCKGFFFSLELVEAWPSLEVEPLLDNSHKPPTEPGSSLGSS